MSKAWPGGPTYHVVVNNAPAGATIELANSMDQGRPVVVALVNGSAWIPSSPVALFRGYDATYFTAWPQSSLVNGLSPTFKFLVRDANGNIKASVQSPYSYDVPLSYGACMWSTGSFSNPDTYFQIAVNTDVAHAPADLASEWVVECHNSDPWVGPYGVPPNPVELIALEVVVGPVRAGSDYATWTSLHVRRNLAYPFYLLRPTSGVGPKLFF